MDYDLPNLDTAAMLRKHRLVNGFSIWFETGPDPEGGPKFLRIFMDVDELARIDSKLAAMRMLELTLAQCAATPLQARDRPAHDASMRLSDFGYTLRDDAFCLTARYGDALEEHDTNELPRAALELALASEGMVDGFLGWTEQGLLVSNSAQSFVQFAADVQAALAYGSTDQAPVSNT